MMQRWSLRIMVMKLMLSKIFSIHPFQQNYAKNMKRISTSYVLTVEGQIHRKIGGKEMKTYIVFGMVFALSLTTSGYVFAQSEHDHDTQDPSASAPHSGSTGDDQNQMMQKMMPMMMRMHAEMMKTGGMGMKSGAGDPGMMMDREMMQMMGSGMMKNSSTDVVANMIISRLSEFDANADGNLSLDEFKALHAAMTVESTVDKFQHLDADGNGQITKDEMSALSQRMQMRGMKKQGKRTMDDMPRTEKGN